MQFNLPIARRSSVGLRRSSCIVDFRSSDGRRSSSFNDRLSSCAFFSSLGGCLRSLYLRLPANNIINEQIARIFHTNDNAFHFSLVYYKYRHLVVCALPYHHNVVWFLAVFDSVADHSCLGDHNHSHLLHPECAYDAWHLYKMVMLIIICYWYTHTSTPPKKRNSCQLTDALAVAARTNNHHLHL